MNTIMYKKGYKYQTVEIETISTGILPPQGIKTKWIELTVSGLLIIRDGYAWDGPSGPTIDTKNFMRGSLVHDAFYQLFRNGLLSSDKYRKKSDIILYQMCREDGMSFLRARYVYYALRVGGDDSASADNVKKVYSAPF